MNKIVSFAIISVLSLALFAGCNDNNRDNTNEEKTSVTTESPEATNTVPPTEGVTVEDTYTVETTTEKELTEATTEPTEAVDESEETTEQDEDNPLIGTWVVRDAQELPFSVFCFGKGGVVREGINLSGIMSLSSNNEFSVNGDLKGIADFNGKTIVIKNEGKVIASFERINGDTDTSSMDGTYEWGDHSGIVLDGIPIDDTVEIEIQDGNFFMYWITGEYESNGNTLSITTKADGLTKFECIQNSDDIAMTTDGKVMHLRRN